MARKHKPRPQREHTLSSRERLLKKFQRRLQRLQAQIDQAFDQQIHLSELLLAHQDGQWSSADTVLIQRTALQEQTRSLQTQIAHRLQWITRLRQHPVPLNTTLAQSIQDANRHTLEQRGQLRRYPRSSFYAHWPNPPVGPLEPTRSARPVNPTIAIRRQPVNLATRTSQKQPIDCTHATVPKITDLTQP